MGLPGSGKTTYALELEDKNKYEIVRIDLDLLLKRSKSKSIKRLSNLKSYVGRTKTIYIIDGLIHSNEQLLKVINNILNNKELDRIEVHYWEENKEQCLINDRYRRPLSSKTSINNLILDVPNISQLQEVFINTFILNHQVVLKPSWLIFSDKYSLGCTLKNQYFKSDSWLNGGTYGNVWNDELYSLEGEEPLKSFEEFDNLILSIKEDITFIDYKELYNHCVSTGISYENDYYGGSSAYAFYQCDVKKLYQELIDKEIIKEGLL